MYPSLGYTAPNARTVAARNFFAVGDGMYQRRPPRHLFADAFAADGSADILRMYRQTNGPTLIVRCTESGAPGVLHTERDVLCADNPYIAVSRFPLTHLAPAWNALDEVLGHVAPLLRLPG